MKLLILFLVKKPCYVNNTRFFQNMLRNLLLWSRYGAGPGTVTYQKSEPEP
jgi:hypothetical protein